jgi:hypothetical protein
MGELIMRNNKREAKEAYDILLRRLISEDRIIAERNSLFFLASSFLFLGFVTLSSDALILRIIIPLIGLFWSLIIYRLNQFARRALHYFHGGLKTLEEESSAFSYMRKKKITPHGDPGDDPFYKDNWLLKGLTFHSIHLIWIPLPFSILWICSLIWVLY